MRRGYLIWEFDIDSPAAGYPVAQTPHRADALKEIDKWRRLRAARAVPENIIRGIRTYEIKED